MKIFEMLKNNRYSLERCSKNCTKEQSVANHDHSIHIRAFIFHAWLKPSQCRYRGRRQQQLQQQLKAEIKRNKSPKRNGSQESSPWLGGFAYWLCCSSACSVYVLPRNRFGERLRMNLPCFHQSRTLKMIFSLEMTHQLRKEKWSKVLKVLHFIRFFLVFIFKEHWGAKC